MVVGGEVEGSIGVGKEGAMGVGVDKWGAGGGVGKWVSR